ncbi:MULTISPECIES: FAD-dependent oxidoreductase [Thalassospira]|mgnify:FL=1|jgi:2-octaprenyl-6-methoxyphenol hydroxylase|uniref:2-octaprenyl-6-methoxyphenyl hydroxylase n=1 Tax=Thalassospira xiamenensis TaxID=220697 RepID=A0ABR5Y6G7_9PROT|nr:MULTISPECIES: FAD-dependent oxidoreductase [Thalassospira]MAL28150.1 2-octaprenyl-6-methoxyphenyl hydroxylase [Thalassospira sp.]MBR9781124.1 FAD-dependent oxidoreductase [Rhodospirillales bacterium]KZD06862.1 2-octaprenyl-6-methoxyphenyl hydroxylase [Thalassospira xiamenensis]KZD09149.1 2-octaprenyl-6-methoxyphenyl hydroxylase [Thalassospira xiamenensis]MBL4839324.1 FAD-dependent monooxygenase [Thalassospira sp.]|tara:strand:- start:41769 stop:42959 length:1191 start_codon:yes stop_codon:yes gene_type:complete
MIETDILIAGGGIAGMSAAARFAADGHRIMIVDPAPADIGEGTDLRTTAFLQPGIDTLKKAGVWDAIKPTGAELRVMRIVDAGGTEMTPRETADFDGAETTQGFFGWNVSNKAARVSLMAKLETLPNVDFRFSTTVTGFTGTARYGEATLSGGETVRAKLVVAADGRNSSLREFAGIKHRRWAYDQSALVFVVTHDKPHDNISTEIHRTGGPLTLVPMPDLNGKPCSSVVWMTPADRAQQLYNMDDATLSAEITRDTMSMFGPLTVASPRAVWPMISQVPSRLISARLALVAEAAHVVPPIGAQGLNMSLHDIETLADLMAKAKLKGEDIGATTLLKSYERKQLPKTLARVGGIDLLNRASMFEPRTLRDLRYAGLTAINRIGPLRKLAIKVGVGK